MLITNYEIHILSMIKCSHIHVPYFAQKIQLNELSHFNFHENQVKIFLFLIKT